MTVGAQREGDLLTPAQVASLLGVSTASVRLWAAEGRLPFSTTPGGHRRFARGDVLELVAEGKGREFVPDEPAADLGTRERVWIRTIAAALRAGASDLGAASEVGARLAIDAERWEMILERSRRDGGTSRGQSA